ncbi:hypothetical protein KM043_008936 [Ampulex compressa]|nr:hypothetical protein KM043_008936 [Ampulex compressa]
MTKRRKGDAERGEGRKRAGGQRAQQLRLSGSSGATLTGVGSARGHDRESRGKLLGLVLDDFDSVWRVDGSASAQSWRLSMQSTMASRLPEEWTFRRFRSFGKGSTSFTKDS